MDDLHNLTPQQQQTWQLGYKHNKRSTLFLLTCMRVFLGMKGVPIFVWSKWAKGELNSIGYVYYICLFTMVSNWLGSSIRFAFEITQNIMHIGTI
jgi:hypothetical protein